MKNGRRGREHDKRPGAKQDAPALWPTQGAGVFHCETAGPFMIDGPRRNRQHRAYRQRRKNRQKKKGSPLRKYCTEYAHDDGHEDIPDAVEDSVATKPSWQGVTVDETDRYRGNDRRKHAAKDRHSDIGGEDDWNGWRPDDGEAANRENHCTGDEKSALSPRFVDPSADRGVQH